MEKKRYLFTFLGFLLLAVLVACGNSEPVSSPTPMVKPHAYPEPFYDPVEVAADVEAILSGEQTSQATDPEPEMDETSEEGEVVEEVETAVDNCVACHTDKDALIDTAKPQEEVVSENEGEG